MLQEHDSHRHPAICDLLPKFTFSQITFKNENLITHTNVIL